MSEHQNAPNAERAEFEELLFDYVNGSLDQADQICFAELLQAHTEWQSEVEQTQFLFERACEIPPLALAPDRWEKFAQQILLAPVAATKPKVSWLGWLDAFNRPWVFASVLAILVGQAFMLAPSSNAPPAPDTQFRSGGQQTTAARYLISFKGEATEMEMRDLLQRAGMDIVNGPDAQGRYALAPRSQADESLLKTSPIVLKLEAATP